MDEKATTSSDYGLALSEHVLVFVISGDVRDAVLDWAVRLALLAYRAVSTILSMLA